MSPRSRGATARHSGNVSCAAPRAALASSTVASATSASVSPVAGSSTASVPPSPASRHSPPMNSRVLTASRIVCSAVAVLMVPRLPGCTRGHRWGSAQRLADADVVSGRVVQRAVEDAVALLDWLLENLGAGVADALEHGAAVVGAEDQGAHRPLGQQRLDGLDVLGRQRR